ncbi:hypothetical protein [Methyloradius palustris]|uniref:Uncharacterized protein n=1 Tax=Methyloradius palustris TaxID=2778876 RepID=A0A8E4AXA6_9PROT|nr:hypothetical protein [Methyloradius palustris]BCM26197.1 hypothetical protein ZMTM_24560 [Methyloradius palustris]
MKTKIIKETTAEFVGRERPMAGSIDDGMRKEKSHAIPYELDDGPLSKADITWIKQEAKPFLPKGKLIKSSSLM